MPYLGINMQWSRILSLWYLKWSVPKNSFYFWLKESHVKKIKQIVLIMNFVLTAISSSSSSCDLSFFPLLFFLACNMLANWTFIQNKKLFPSFLVILKENYKKRFSLREEKRCHQLCGTLTLHLISLEKKTL